MLNTLSFSRHPVLLPHVVLHVVWHVDADESYHIYQRMMSQGADYLAIRTLHGVGEMHLADGRCFVLAQGTLLLIPKAKVSHYFCKHERWHFYWFEFNSEGEPQFQFGRIHELPVHLGEEGELAKCFNALGANPDGQMALMAQALFMYLLSDWLRQGVAKEQKHAVSEDDVALLLAQGVRQKLSVAELAQKACMCERSFRMLVLYYTGKSPKEYMLHQALSTALIMLRTTNLSIAEIASDVGFSNALYFSRIFKNHFGIQPSKARWLHDGCEIAPAGGGNG